MLKAAVDIGTNSTRLYIADVDKGIKRVEKRTTITRLGKMVDSKKRLGKEGMEKNIEVLLDYKKIALSYGVSHILAIATSAVRDAKNRDEFVSMVKKMTGIDINVISGEEEAKLGFIGASSVLREGYGVVCDIGGGSTELICGNKDRICVSKSIDIGAVRMTERFLSPGVIGDIEIQRASTYIKEAICGTVKDIKNTGSFTFIGIGGTITTLAAMDQELIEYDIDRVHGYKLSKDRVDVLFSKLKNSSLEEKKSMPGLQSERADIIAAGTLILKIIMEELNSSSIIVSESDILDGLLLKRLQL